MREIASFEVHARVPPVRAKLTAGTPSFFLRAAIRLALELDLHLPFRRPLPEDDLEARKLVARERIWIQIICFDRTSVPLKMSSGAHTADLTLGYLVFLQAHAATRPTTDDRARV